MTLTLNPKLTAQTKTWQTLELEHRDIYGVFEQSKLLCALLRPLDLEVAFGFRVWDLGFRVSDLGFRVSDLGFRVSDLEFT